MTCEFEWQQPVVVMKQCNDCGAKGHSRYLFEVTMERRMR